MIGHTETHPFLTASARFGRIALACIALAASGIYAYVEMFSQFQYYDDEGYLMVSVKSFLDGHPLFDDTFSLYGPFYFLVARAFHTISGLAVSHDVTRLVTIALWLATAALIAVSVYRLTASFAWALVAYLQTVLWCRSLVNEPGHPQALVLALTVSTVVIAAFRASRRSGAVLLGAIAACVLLTKINVGVYTTIALLLAYLAVTVRTWPVALALGAVSVMATLLPFVVMRGADWAENYARLAAASMAACSLAIWRTDVRDRLHASPVGIFAASAAVTSVVILAATLLTGTSIDGLISGVLLAPLRFPAVFSIPWRLPASGVLLGVIAGAMAVSAPVFAPSRRAALGVLLKLTFAILVAVAVRRSTTDTISTASLVWVILLPAGPEPWRTSAFIPRAILCLLAASHVLVGYPVAGSQERWATLLLLPAAVISLADVSSVLALRVSVSVRRLAELALLSLIVAFYYPQFSPVPLLERYHALVPLQLPGASRMRLRQEQVQLYREIVANIDEQCDTFVSMPGFNSLYFWTRQDPPTAQNATTWMTLFDDQMQQNIVDRLMSLRSLCVVYNQPVTEEWVGGRNIDRGPLVRYIRTSFRTLRTTGDFELMVPKDRAGPD